MIQINFKNQYNVFVASLTSQLSLKQVLVALHTHSQSICSPQQLATKMVVQGYATVGIDTLKLPNYSIIVGTQNVVVIDDKNKTIFNGTIQASAAWASYQANPYNDFVGSVVKFNYNGGSKVGERHVYVTDVEQSGNETYLNGKDLQVLLLQDDINAHRKYRVSQIQGKVVQLMKLKV